MKRITPRGMVQAVGEGSGVFMHDRAINGCWDIPNLYGWRQDRNGFSVSLTKVKSEHSMTVPSGCHPMGPLLAAECQSEWTMGLPQYGNSYILWCYDSQDKKNFLAFTLTASPVCLFPLNSIFLIWVVAFWWQFTIASQKGIVLKCWNALTSTWKTVPCMILTYIPSHPHRCLCLLPWWKDHPPSISGWSLWHFGSHTQHIPPERTDYFINSHSVLHLQPSPSSLAGSFPEATKLKALSHLKKNKVLFWSPLLF